MSQIYGDIFDITKKFDGMCYQLTMLFKSENVQNLSIECKGPALTITGNYIDNNKNETIFHYDTTVPGDIRNRRPNAFMTGKNSLVVRYELGHEMPIQYEQ